MNVLIVHAHHEPKSFSSALKDRAIATLTRLGHAVEVSDLYAMGFDPVSDRRNFTTVNDPAALKQQREEIYASAHDGFAPELAREMEKVLRADLLIFNFPLWWFGMPATLKGWVDRVFAYGKIYAAGKRYETGIGRGKRALITVTTGGAGASYDGYGFNPSLSAVLAPIHHGIFWFNGFAPLPPFVAYAVAHVGDDERTRMLAAYERYLSTLDERQAITLPPMHDFLRESDGTATHDRVGRWMIEVRSASVIDAAHVTELRRGGAILASWSAHEADASALAWFVVRAATHAAAETIAQRLVDRVEATRVAIRALDAQRHDDFVVA